MFSQNLSNDSEVILKIKAALEELIINDSELLTRDVHERSITHHFANYLVKKFPKYHIDVEYNRDGNDVKKIKAIKNKIGNCNCCGETDSASIFPDIIIHKRGTQNNYIVIETKKSSADDKAIEYDRDKLKLMKGELKYNFAFLVIYPCDINKISLDECIELIQ